MNAYVTIFVVNTKSLSTGISLCLAYSIFLSLKKHIAPLGKGTSLKEECATHKTGSRRNRWLLQPP